MPDLIVWKDREIDKIKQTMDRLCNQLIDDFCLPRFPLEIEEWPRINLSETEEMLVLEVDAPGVHPEAFDISVTEDALTIKGEAEEEASDRIEGGRHVQRRRGTFSRTLQLPCRIRPERVEARSIEKGLLRITMPKCKPPESKVVRIQIK